MNKLITVKYTSVHENLACSLIPRIPSQKILKMLINLENTVAFLMKLL